jgi:hypothetical protein
MVGPWPAYPFSPSDHTQTMHYCFEMFITTNQKGLQFQVVANSTLSVIPNKPMYSLNNIEQWTTPFIRSMAIYAEKFPEAIPHLAKHAGMMREMATSQNSNAWFLTV